MNDLLIAGGIGVAFGWALECAGLGDPPKLAGQFYLRDFTVLKVMLSAMLTAMLGVFWGGRLGMLGQVLGACDRPGWAAGAALSKLTCILGFLGIGFRFRFFGIRVFSGFFFRVF